VGVLLLSLRMARGWRWMRRLVAKGETATDGPAVDAAIKAAQMLGLKRLPRVVLTDDPVSPFTFGVRQPVVVLPRAFLLQADEPGLLAVLAHEAAHLRRRDSLFGLVLGICDTLYFFHPVVHWVRRRILLEREKACDDLVLATSKAKPSAYAKAICAAAQLARNTRPLTSPPVLVAESFGDLKHRLTALASGTTRRATLSKASLASLLLLGALCVPGIVLTAAAPAPVLAQAQPAAPVPQTLPVTSPAGTRIIHFPPDRALGVLSVRTESITRRFRLGPDYDAVDDWDAIATAQGDVAVPAGRDIRLTLHGQALRQDLSPLRNLGPNDLQSLYAYCEDSERVPVDQRVMPFIAGLTGLKYLDISAMELTDWGMQYIAGLTSLKDLRVRSLRVTTSGFRYLENLQSLETFRTWSSPTDDAFASLAKLPLLRELAVNVSYVQGPGLAQLAALPGLQYLELNGRNFGDGGLRYLRTLPSLKCLRLMGQDFRISNEGMRDIAQIPGLEELYLLYLENITDAGIAELANLRSLRLLELHHCLTTDAALASLSEMQSLEDLALSNNPKSVVSDAGLAYLPKLKNLKRLWAMNMSNGPITDAGLERIATMTSLREFCVSGGEGITDKGIGCLTALPRLEGFALSSDSHSLSDATLGYIGTMKNLRTLELFCNRIEFTTSGLNQLNGLSQLEFLSVENARHDDAVLNLAGLTRLINMSVRMVPYTDVDLECLGSLTSLRRLQCINGISDEGLAHLAGLTRLQLLGIGNSHLTDDGLRHLANMKGLVDLRISGAFSARATQYLASLGSLHTLGVWNNSTLTGPQLDAALKAVEQLKVRLPNLVTVNLQQQPVPGYGAAGAI
jgi:beta-lactamase regulating signal transducer with metallopeptidase domain/Leucine-rich repeat (LRR) protein